ncbi:MAG: hypothetical protein M3Z85_05860 [Acidobacteriota bacterium]|nr:hypothetical protein [Acidobacteriota bacterium]
MHLVTDGNSVYLEENPDGIIDLLTARQPMFLVCVSDQVRRIGSGQRKPPKSERVLAYIATIRASRRRC